MMAIPRGHRVAVPLRAAAGGLGRRARRWRLSATTRARIFGWYVLLLAVALGFGLLLQRSILLSQLDSDVDSQLVQEVEELQQLAGGRDPNTGEPFGSDVAAIFQTFLSRNVPVEGEALFTLVDGEPFASTVAPLQLLDDAAIVERWAATTSATRGTLDTALGEVRYLAVPIVFEGEVRGVFVVAVFMEERLRDVDRVVRGAGYVFGGTLLAATAVGWFVAGRVLRPIGLLTEAARSVTDSNWKERIPVRGNDEIVELTHTFNEMLDRLESAFATQRRFIDDAGHELRTPITVIRGHLDLLDGDAATRAETLRLVDDELDRMARIVDDLLLLAKSEVPDFLEISIFDLGELVSGLVARAMALGDRTWVNGGAPALRIAADRQRLTQAVMNLARNAVEHTGPGDRIEIGARATAGFVQVWVRDEGEGIAAADQQRIFERFARGGVRPRGSEGAGLGLAIVRAIAEAHGGRVEVASRPGEGATFTMTIPIDRPAGGRP